MAYVMRRTVLGLMTLTASAAVSDVARGADGPGAKLYAAKCAACHGVDGAGSPATKTPIIAGLDQAYVRRQLAHFRDGQRPVDDLPMAQGMLAVLTPLSATAVDQLSAHIASMPTVRVDQTLAPAGFRGRGLYSGCASCHGINGEGVPALGAPRLAGQYRWYVRNQLARFRSGRRGAHPEDVRGQQMRAMAVAIASEADVDVLASYVAGMGQ